MQYNVVLAIHLLTTLYGAMSIILDAEVDKNIRNPDMSTYNGR